MSIAASQVSRNGFSKEAALPGLGSISKFLVEGLPKLTGLVQSGAKAVGLNAERVSGSIMGKSLSASKAGILTGAGGAFAGAVTGAAHAQPGERGKGAIHGAALGGLLGYAGGAIAGKSLPTFGNKTVETWGAAGKRLGEVAKESPNMGLGELLNRSTNYMAKNFKTNFQALKPGEGPAMKPLMGKNTFATEMAPGGKQPLSVTIPGTLARAGQAVFSKNPVKNISNVLAEDLKDATKFTMESGGNLYRADRSTVGKVVNPLVASGLGMGAVDAMTAKNKDGTPASIGTRLRKGTTSALGWGLVPPVMAGKLVYDTSKSLRHGNKTPQA